MSRLTKKENNRYIFTHVDEDRQFVVYDLCNKLGKLEDLEDELGCPLDVVFKALELACERLDWDCPCGQDLIDDLDCENRCTPDIDYSVCWKKYFLKEVLGNANN